MKRSDINRIMREAVKFFEDQKFFLPKFAYWTIKDWKNKGKEIQEIIINKLGWDITDYGSEDFSKIGLLHFTIRNGNVKDILKGGKPYCEKIMILKDGQALPMHFHYNKIEDIINRGGGILQIQIYNSTKDEQLANTQVKVSIDGESRTYEAGFIIELYPGDSITLKNKVYHNFKAKEGYGKVLIGEVSSVNDDYTDNKFLKNINRFGEIDEDEKPLYLLYDDYEKYIQI
ncbi:MAG: D-lyxose/D-mannose family sugar isomerase [Promethearchaeota archaeon]|nr:MAG: D-lyxose/D-mannose family sugar isomerase [Candidatus Lokiarchaeota archaeon]